MRLTRLRLERYGHFEDTQVELDPAPGKLNVIYALNGAGKSVFREALADLLFGIGGQSPMGFRFDYKGLRLTVHALTTEGTPISFCRRKGLGNTLTNEEGKPTEPALLAAHLGAIDRRALEQLFALDTAKLREGGQSMLKSGGLVADALLSAGGLPHAHLLRRELDKIADDLAPARKFAGRPFYAAAEKFVAARTAVGRALIRPDAWNSQCVDLRAVEDALAEARRKSADAFAAKTRLERLRRTRPTVTALDAAEAWLRENPHAPALPPRMRERLMNAEADLRHASEKLRQEAARRDLLAEEMRAIPHNDVLLRHASAVDQLAEHAGAVGKALGDLPARIAELGELETRVARTVRDLGQPAANPSSLIPPRAVIARARELIGLFGRHDMACREATRRHRDLELKIAAQRAMRAQAPAGVDCSGLVALSDQVRAHGDPALAMRDAAGQLSARHTAIESAMAALPHWQHGPDALRAMVLPGLPLLERTHAELVRAEAALARQAEKQADARTQLDDAQAARSAIVSGVVVPDREAVTRARVARQSLWAWVARTAFGEAAPGPTELAFLAGAPLEGAYERAVADADAIADRRADEGALVERARSATWGVGQAREKLEKAEVTVTACRSAHQAALEAWQALLPGGLPCSLRLDDIKLFVSARLRVIERHEELAAAQIAKAELEAAHARWTALLTDLLAVAPKLDLAGLLAEAQRTAKASQEAAISAGKLDAEIAQREVEFKEAQEKCSQADGERDGWTVQWSKTLAALGRPDDETPSTTETILGLLADLDGDLTRAATLRQRIADMGEDNARFSQNIAILFSDCGQSDNSDDGATAALGRLRALRSALEDARAQHSRQATLAEKVEQASRQVLALTGARDARQTDYTNMLATIGAPTLAEAEALLVLAEARVHHQEILSNAQTRLLADGDGIDADKLRAELAAANADDVARDLYTVGEDAHAASEDVSEHAASAALLRQNMTQTESETTYVDALVAQREAEATVDRVLREALVARVAASLLASAMEEVESQGTPEMLKRISFWFTRLTGNAYREVGVEPTEHGMALLLTDAAFPDRPKSVNGLSEGTRDQLFLALRLAAIETHPVALPFIADDILQTADDTRAEAALGALVELSRRTQVILLTHHQHIAQLAMRSFGHAVHMASLN